ncbi:calcium/sodium antiporter [Sanguibacter suaedae]|uniref:Calcium/sodium antiporter n=1 Tax=Sanguibacter suaedae TaxID=2795737 RepID=A0A934MEH5_9MICO|nr:calcium/sodium antiporter [Sanguibacter suaedae]MBI9115694.1 calcium/sodium antiporter [Sanguibacter suaedae]
MDLLDVARIVAGLVLLVGGGELLVRGASSLARRAGISALVVGLTVVSAATSAPELAVSVGAVFSEESGLAVGNVVGSNIANVLLILGLSALVVPLLVTRQVVRFDIPVMVGLSVLLLVMALDGGISTLDGVVLLAAVVAYTVLTIVVGRRRTAAPIPVTGGAGDVATDDAGDDDPPAPVLRSVAFLVVGVGLLVLGATWLVDGAVSIATGFGVSSLVVGLTVVAIGTSLPELATSIIAVRRGERDMAVGNIVGSNIFNIGLVLGLPAILAGDGIPVPDAAVALDIPLMLAASVALLPVAFTGFAIARWEGGVFLLLYVAYTAFVVLAATEHDALDGFTTAMAWFVLPLLALTLVVFTAYEVGLRRGRAQMHGQV